MLPVCDFGLPRATKQVILYVQFLNAHCIQHTKTHARTLGTLLKHSSRKSLASGGRCSGRGGGSFVDAMWNMAATCECVCVCVRMCVEWIVHHSFTPLIHAHLGHRSQHVSHTQTAHFTCLQLTCVLQLLQGGLPVAISITTHARDQMSAGRPCPVCLMTSGAIQ